MDDDRVEELNELYELYKDIDELELKIEKLSFEYDDTSDNMILAEMNVAKDNLKDKQTEYSLMEENINMSQKPEMV